MKKAFLVALLASAAVASQANAASFEFPSQSTSYSSATNGAGTIPNGGQSAFMWTTGDFVSQLVADTGLASVTSFSNDFTIQNYLHQNMDVDALINGTTVGSFTVLACPGCGSYQNLSVSFSFGAVAGVGGDDYTISYVLKDTMPSGDGSLSFVDGGRGTLSDGAVPEPATWALLVAGFGAVGYSMRRKQAVAVRYA